MYVAVARLALVIGEAHSLKEKRMVIRRIKDRVRERVGVVIAEVGAPEVRDSWQRGELGCAVVSADRGKALELIDDVVRVAMAAGGAQIVAIARDALTFDAAPTAFAPIDDRTGAGDKAQASDDFIPDAWREELDR